MFIMVNYEYIFVKPLAVSKISWPRQWITFLHIFLIKPKFFLAGLLSFGCFVGCLAAGVTMEKVWLTIIEKGLLPFLQLT